jgi:hypothetical protein
MAAVWVLLGKTVFSAELIESSREQGVKTVTVPVRHRGRVSPRPPA